MFTYLLQSDKLQIFKNFLQNLHLVVYIIYCHLLVTHLLRECGHPYVLIEHKYKKTKCSYIIRSIFEFV